MIPIPTERFHELANAYETWYGRARQLLDASDLLMAHERPWHTVTGSVPLMLLAMGFECLLKAWWLRQGNSLAEDGQMKESMVRGAHGLDQLAQLVGFTVDADEREVLKRLSFFITLGRYPVASSVKFSVPFGWDYGRDQAHVREMGRRLIDVVDHDDTEKPR